MNTIRIGTMTGLSSAVIMGTLLSLIAGCGSGTDAGESADGQEVLASGADLHIDSRGADVGALHEYLTANGYFPNPELASQYPAWRPVAQAPADREVFDQNTHQAVTRFQANAGLEVTGVVDEATRAALARTRCGVPDNMPKLDATDKFARFQNWLQRRDITWKLSEVGIPPSIGLANATNAARAAIQTWASATSLSPTQVSGAPGSPNANVLIQWGATAANVFGTTNGQTVTMSTNFNFSTFDLQTAMTHELGHALGLSHSGFGTGINGTGVVMFPFVASGTRNLFVDDKVGTSSFFDTYPKVTTTTAKDIAVGANGSVWIIDTTPIGSDFGIRRFNGTSFLNGNAFDATVDFDAAVRIAVLPDGRPMVVNSGGGIFIRNSDSAFFGGWTQICGAAKDIGAGADGSVWVIGAGAGNQPVFKWNGRFDCAAWDMSNGSAVRVSVAADGKPWVVQNDGSIWRRSTSMPFGGSWQNLPGRVADIGLSPDGSQFGSPPGYAWSVATASSGQVSLALWDEQSNIPGTDISNAFGWVTGNQFTPLGSSGPAIAVAVGPNAQPWVVNQVGDIFTAFQ
jgi:hypothetical protein